MNTKQAFQLDEIDYHVCELQPKHMESLQKLLNQCEDYAITVEGEGVSPTAAQEIFQSAPPGRSLNDKFLYGILNQKEEIVGVFEGMRNYPSEMTWWIGLLMLAPEVRGHGLGQKLIRSFKDYVHLQQGKVIMLGVVEDNLAAYRFWQKQGFELVRQTEPRRFGKKTQTVYVMRRDLT